MEYVTGRPVTLRGGVSSKITKTLPVGLIANGVKQNKIHPKLTFAPPQSAIKLRL
jgi:hypothetical protein